jgi:hypothetical protein
VSAGNPWTQEKYNEKTVPVFALIFEQRLRQIFDNDLQQENVVFIRVSLH